MVKLGTTRFIGRMALLAAKTTLTDWDNAIAVPRTVMVTAEQAIFLRDNKRGFIVKQSTYILLAQSVKSHDGSTKSMIPLASSNAVSIFFFISSQARSSSVTFKVRIAAFSTK